MSESVISDLWKIFYSMSCLLLKTNKIYNFLYVNQKRSLIKLRANLVQFSKLNVHPNSGKHEWNTCFSLIWIFAKVILMLSTIGDTSGGWGVVEHWEGKFWSEKILLPEIYRYREDQICNHLTHVNIEPATNILPIYILYIPDKIYLCKRRKAKGSLIKLRVNIICYLRCKV